LDRGLVNASPVAEIADRTWRLQSELGGRNVYQYLIGSDDGGELALIDTGVTSTPREVVRPALRMLGLSPDHLRLVVVTHPDVDHQGGLAAIRDLSPGALLACGFYDRPMVSRPEQLVRDRYQAYLAEHEVGYGSADLAWIRARYGAPTTIHVTFSGGETVRVGERLLEVHHAPGHSAGHLVLFEPASGLLFSSDAVHWRACPGVDGGPALCPTYEEVDAYLGSIELIRALEPAALHSGHWPVQAGSEIEAFLDESRDFVALVDRVVLARVAEPATLAELCDEVQREAGPWESEPQLLQFCVHGHLRRLQRQGRVRALDATAAPRKFGLPDAALDSQR
jgi:glyoxylase-like metal-dependent hydrolase (beta-lactamase superfamily II)